LRQGGLFAPISREGSLVLNNVLLSVSCATVLVGTLYPLALEAISGEKISVGPPFFNYTFVPLFIPIFFVMPIGQLLAWKRGDLLGAAQRLTVVAIVGIVAALIFFAIQGGPALSAAMAGLAIFVILGSFADIVSRARAGSSAGAILSRLWGMPRSAWGTAFAHAGMGVTLLGLAATGWGVEKIASMKPGESVDVGHFNVTLDNVAQRPGPNYRETAAQMTIRSGGAIVAKLEPSRRFFTSRRMTTSQAGLLNVSLGQIHIVISDQETEGPLDTRLYWKPLVSLIWLGSVLMALGGGIALTDRRIRLGIAERARRRRMPAKPVAAE
jgi:cytochrome c-type biogenesis protein CcmF